MKNLLLLLLIFTLTSCKDDEVVFVPPVIEDDTVEIPTNLDVVWEREMIDIDYTISSTISPIFYEGDIVHSTDVVSTTYLVRRNGETGELIWKLANGNFEGLIGKRGSAIVDGKLGVLAPNLSVVDLSAGESIGISEKSFPNNRVEGYNGYFYQAFEDTDATINNTSSIYRTADNGQNWEVVYSVDITNGFRPSLHPPVFYENVAGETIAIFQNRQYNFDLGQGKVDLYAYNIDVDSLVWFNENVDPTGNSSVSKPIIDNDLFYFQGAKRVICIDINSGEEIWMHETVGNGSYLICNMVLAEGKLFLNRDGKNIRALDKSTGEEIWKNEIVKSENSARMAYHDGIIYFVSEGRGTLCALRADNGGIIWEEDSPNDDTFNGLGFRGGLTINPDLGLLYAIDGRYVMAIKLAEL